MNKIPILFALIALFAILFDFFMRHNSDCEYIPIIIAEKVSNYYGVNYHILIKFNDSNDRILLNIDKKDYDSLNVNDSLYLLIKQYKIGHKIWSREIVKKIGDKNGIR